jgi:Cu(I)-responsive transcriptional regulator
MSERFTIGQIARQGACKVQTIRYYESIGLLPPPMRTAGNQRIFSAAHIERLRFIRHSRELGFSLDEVRELIGLSDDPHRDCAEVDQIARQHLREVESKIKRLQGMRSELKRMVSHCAGGSVTECQIIKVLSDHTLCVADDHGDKHVCEQIEKAVLD